MVTLKHKLSIGLVLTVLLSRNAQCQTQIEEVLPSIIERENVVGNLEHPELDSQKVAVVIRIPAATISKSLNRDFENSEAVNREVLGTHSQGQAHCHGSVACTLENNPNGAAFCCRISGTVNSKTCGTNGPAIIRSKAKTTYVALKRFVFNGTSFVSTPTTVTATTQLTITGIESSLPALRGRIVRRVATKRAQQSHAQAEAITASITREELSSRIDTEFDSRLSDLNQKLASRLSLVKQFRDAGNEVFVRSFNDSMEIGLLTAPLTRNDVDINQVPIGESIELWIGKGRAEPLDDMPLAQLPAITSLIGQAPHWLATYFSSSPQLSKLDEKTLKVKRHKGWIVIQLQD